MADPTFAQQMNTPAGYAAIGSIGSAINAGQNTRAVQSMLGQQTRQLREQIAYQRKIMEEQIVLRAKERVRQQMMAQATGDAFGNSVNQYQGFEGRTGAASNTIADSFKQVLARQAPDISPQAEGMVADRIASANQLANDRSTTDANALANVQGVARAFSDTGTAVNRNNQLASMLRNFAQGSAGASEAEIQARAGQLFQPRIVQPTPSMLGDMFMGFSDLAVINANKQKAPASPYGLMPQGDSYSGIGLRMQDNPGVGLRMDRPSGLGIRGPSGMRIVGD